VGVLAGVVMVVVLLVVVGVVQPVAEVTAPGVVPVLVVELAQRAVVVLAEVLLPAAYLLKNLVYMLSRIAFVVLVPFPVNEHWKKDCLEYLLI